MQLWLGTSGFSYPDWVGGFYPPGTASGRMFAHYVQHFPLVELNYTFYRMPAAKDLDRFGRQSPDGFQFIVKLHQSFSHELRDDGLGEFLAAIKPLVEQGKLLGLLAQFPQRFHDERANREALRRLADHFGKFELAVEFRHRSWGAPDVPGWLQGLGVHLVSVDVPAIPALYPTGLVQSGRLIYVRFHSRRASAWYAGEKDRYDYSYSDEELQDWLKQLASRVSEADRALLLFNNCRRSQAAANAERVRQLLIGLAPQLQVVPPLVSPTSRQRALFEV
jgi:uncharacterized protein YecE (DUF72 family)